MDTPALHEVLDKINGANSTMGLDPAQARRLAYYRKNWLYYLGNHWTYARGDGETQTTINYCKRIVNLHCNFAFSKGFEVTVPDDPTTEEDEAGEREFVRKMLEESWRKNNKSLWCLNAGQMGGVTGDVFIRCSWDDSNPLEAPYARADVYPSHLAFPDYEDLDTGEDISKLKRMLLLIPYKEIETTTVKTGVFSSDTSSSVLTTKFYIEEWINRVLDEGGKEIRPAWYRKWKGEQLLIDRENPLGIIPVVHISNYPLAGEYFGMSDLDDILELNKELNERSTDISDVVQYHGSPVTVITGAKIGDLEKGVNRVWSLPEGAEAKNLELKGDLIAANTHRESLKNTLLELSHTPPQALGIIQAISNTSGIAIQLQFFPMMEKRNVKVLSYGAGIEAVNRLLIRITEIADVEFGSKMAQLKGDRYRNEVVFPDPMPQDERRALEIVKEKLDIGISNKKKELEKMGFSQGEIDDILEGAVEDMQREMKLQLMYGESAFNTSNGSGGSQLSRGGSSETKGEKIDGDLEVE